MNKDPRASKARKRFTLGGRTQASSARSSAWCIRTSQTLGISTVRHVKHGDAQTSTETAATRSVRKEKRNYEAGASADRTLCTI